MRHLFACLFMLTLLPPGARAAGLPLDETFVGQQKFQEVMNRGYRAGWAKLPLGERVNRFALALRGTPYVNYTLELHDTIEAPSVNMNGMDCSTGISRGIPQGTNRLS